MPGAPASRGVGRYLARDEHIVFMLRRHTVVLGNVVLIWLAALAAGVGAGLLSGRLPGWHLGVVGGWIVLAGAGFLGWRTFDWWLTHYVITDERVLLVEGVVARRVRAVPLSKVTHTDYRRSVFGRIFGYGDLILDSPGGASGLRELTSIPRPDDIYRLIMSLVSRTWSPPHLPPGGPPAGARVGPRFMSGGDPGFGDPGGGDTGEMPRLIL